MQERHLSWPCTGGRGLSPCGHVGGSPLGCRAGLKQQQALHSQGREPKPDILLLQITASPRMTAVAFTVIHRPCLENVSNSACTWNPRSGFCDAPEGFSFSASPSPALQLLRVPLCSSGAGLDHMRNGWVFILSFDVVASWVLRFIFCGLTCLRSLCSLLETMEISLPSSLPSACLSGGGISSGLSPLWAAALWVGNKEGRVWWGEDCAVG